MKLSLSRWNPGLLKKHFLLILKEEQDFAE